PPQANPDLPRLPLENASGFCYASVPSLQTPEGFTRPPDGFQKPSSVSQGLCGMENLEAFRRGFAGWENLQAFRRGFKAERRKGTRRKKKTSGFVFQPVSPKADFVFNLVAGACSAAGES
ncbi:MAG: hypothetical protein J0H55_16620, partial [Chitinophagaceae bacterium]|nr:hypothetical protein [Chitinophagaceae bacterium]